MPEAGLVGFARMAMEVATAVPPYRSKSSNYQYTQIQSVSMLCLMRYEDRTFRETEVRLAEDTELRQAVGLQRMPDYTTLFYCLRRLSEETIASLLGETVRRMPPPPEGGTTVAVDGTGLAPGAVSTSS